MMILRNDRTLLASFSQSSLYDMTLMNMILSRMTFRNFLVLFSILLFLMSVNIISAYGRERGGFLGEQVGVSNDQGVFIDDVRVAYLDGAARNAGVGDTVWEDANRDGEKNADEGGIAGVRIHLYAGDCGHVADPPYRTTETNSAGEYFFAMLYPGDYCLMADENTLPEEYIATSANPVSVHLDANQVWDGADFGFASARAEDRLTVAAYAPCTDISWLQQRAASHHASFLVQDFDACNFTLGASAQEMPGLREDIIGDPHVRDADFDVLTRAAETFPNDPYYNDPNYVYGPQQIHAPAAWEVTTGDEALIVAVVDSGVDPNHPEFAGRLLAGRDFVNDDDDPADDNGHGTHVAGIIAAGIDNGIGIAGIAGNVKILPVKVLNDQNTGWWSDVAEGVTWAVDQGARVLNLSISGSVDSPALQDAISYAISRGAVVVVAAGNDSTDDPQYPASYENVLASGATTYTGERWSLSNFGPNVDVMAPGALVYSTKMGGDYQFMSGTSMAAPHAAGLAALLLSVDPNLTPAQVVDIILDTAVDMGDPNLHGAGLIDAGAAVGSIAPAPYLPPVTSAEAQLLEDASANHVVDPGDTVRYVITIANENDYPLDSVIITATAPAHTTYVEGSTRLNGVPMRDDDAGTPLPLDENGLDIGSVPAKGAVSVSFDVLVQPPDPPFDELSFHAQINNGTSVQTVQVTTPVGGDPCELELKDAEGDVVSSLRIGSELVIAIDDPDENTRATAAQTISATVTNLAASDSEIVTLTETDVDSGQFQGRVQLSKVLGQGQNDGLLHATVAGQTLSVHYVDPDFSPDSCQGSVESLAPGVADVSVQKRVSDDTAQQMQSIVYTITVSNQGPDVATSVVISDAAPAGVDFLSGDVTQGDFDAETGTWLLRQLPAGEAATLAIHARVQSPGGIITNTVRVQDADETDPKGDNNSDAASILVNPVDLQVSKTVNVEEPQEGQEITYTVNVKNLGPSLATGVVISDPLPAGVTFLRATASQGAYDAATGLWQVGDLEEGQNVSLWVGARVSPNRMWRKATTGPASPSTRPRPT